MIRPVFTRHKKAFLMFVGTKYDLGGHIAKVLVVTNVAIKGVELILACSNQGF